MSAPPLPAATVVLLRDGESGPEAFLTRRLDTMRFAPGCHVFPGGRVDELDASPGILARLDGLTAEEAARTLGDPIPAPLVASAFWVAGIRELFEEAGVLLALRGGAPWLPGPADRSALAELRGEIHARRGHFLQVLDRFGLELDGGGLRYFDHWVTPEREPRRFNTRFFLARLPRGQEPDHYAGEASASGWYHPWAAVEGWRQGEMPMFPPTVATLLRLLQYARTSDLFAPGSAPPLPPQAGR